MAACGCDDGLRFDGVSASFRRVLWLVIGINLIMFVVEMGASVLSQSMALRADALDFLGDTFTYSLTLLAIGHSLRWRASAALFKGISLAAMGAWVLGATIYRVFVLGVPDEFIMGGVALAAFTANVTSALLLLRYRDGDANVRSVWLCSRNDAIGNVAVMAAAGGVYLSHSVWPDLLVAALMATLFFHSSLLIIQQALGELRLARTPVAASECRLEG
jgi:Co/Zn/Cd efflux system component